MKKLLILCAFIEACAVTAHYADADAVKPMVFRQSANRYSVLGEGVLATRDCTVTADGMAARVASQTPDRPSAMRIWTFQRLPGSVHRLPGPRR